MIVVWNKGEPMAVKYLIKGKLYDPILFGDEDDDWVGDEENPTCGDCGVHVGENNSVITESKADINFNLSGQLENGFVGGIAGTSRSGINNSYATGTYNLNSTNVTTGGLVGEFSRRREVVEYCYQNIEIQNVSGVTGALVGSLREGIFRNSFAVSTLDNTYGSKELNTELAPYPERNNCQIFASAEQVTNSFGFSSEIWDFDETLPELICFINS